MIGNDTHVPADFTTSDGAQELLSQLLETHISQEKWHNYIWEGRLTAYLFRGGKWEKYTPGETKGLPSGFLFRIFDIYALAMDELKTGPLRELRGAGDEVPDINFRNSDGAAQFLTALLGRDNEISHDSMRQYALRGRIPAYFFKGGKLVRYRPGMSAQGAASGFIFFDEDIKKLAVSSKVGVGRDGYPQWVKDQALNMYYELKERAALNALLPPHQQDPTSKEPSYRDVAAMIKRPWDPERTISWMTLRNWHKAEEKERERKLIKEDHILEGVEEEIPEEELA